MNASQPSISQNNFLQYEPYCDDNFYKSAMIRRMTHALRALNELCDLQTGFAFRTSISEDSKGSHRVLTMAHAVDELITDRLSLPLIQFDSAPESFLLEPGDLIFRSRGVSNQAALIESAPPATVLAAPLIRIRPTTRSHITPEYLLWALNSPSVQRDIDAIARGSIVRMITIAGLRALEIPLPPKEVQHQITRIATLQRQERALSADILQRRALLLEHALWETAQKHSVAPGRGR